MSTLRYITAGESHGKALTGILEGIPAGLEISSGDIDGDLKRRQGGYGRGGRMKIESDRAAILSGIRWGKTIGSPIALMIENKDNNNWNEGMSPHPDAEGSIVAVTRPRPGHADLAGAIKYDQHDIRNILERSSARETAIRVALGAVTKRFLSALGISVGSFVLQIGSQKTAVKSHDMNEKELLKTFAQAEKSVVRCPDEMVSKKMVRLIDRAMKEGNSLGGIFEVFATGVPAGLGSHIQGDRRIDGKIAQAIMGIQAMKGVEIGLGFDMGRKFGSEVMDEILYKAKSEEQRAKSRNTKFSSENSAGFTRRTNFAGGIEGGITNGMPVIVRAAMKPIPTQRKPLRSVDIITKRAIEAAYERSDICAVPAAGVIGEAMVALTIAEAFLEKFGGDSMGETRRNYESYMEYIRKF